MSVSLRSLLHMLALGGVVMLVLAGCKPTSPVVYDTGSAGKHDYELTIRIALDGTLSVSGSVQTDEQIEAVLAAMANDYSNPAVIIMGADALDVSHFVRVLELCQESDVANVVVAAPVEGEE